MTLVPVLPPIVESVLKIVPLVVLAVTTPKFNSFLTEFINGYFPWLQNCPLKSSKSIIKIFSFNFLPINPF